MTARFSFLVKSELFEQGTVLAPEFPRAPCWNPGITIRKESPTSVLQTTLLFVVPKGGMCSAILEHSFMEERKARVCFFLRLDNESDARSFINLRSSLLAVFAARWRCPPLPRFSSPT